VLFANEKARTVAGLFVTIARRGSECKEATAGKKGLDAFATRPSSSVVRTY